MGDLEALQRVASLSLVHEHIHRLIDQLGSICVVSLRPIVASAGVAGDIVVRAEKLTVGAAANSIDGAWL